MYLEVHVCKKKNLKGRSVNRPRCNEILYQRCLASGYTILEVHVVLDLSSVLYIYNYMYIY